MDVQFNKNVIHWFMLYLNIICFGSVLIFLTREHRATQKILDYYSERCECYNKSGDSKENEEKMAKRGSFTLDAFK